MIRLYFENLHLPTMNKSHFVKYCTDFGLYFFPEMRCWTALSLVAAVAVLVAAKENKEDVGTVIGIDLGTTYSW